GEQPLPGAISLPAAEPLIAGLPGTIALGQVPPRHPGRKLPQDPVEHLAVVGPLAARPTIGRQQRGDLGPGLISELVAPDHPSSLAGSHRTRQTYQAAFVRQALELRRDKSPGAACCRFVRTSYTPSTPA